MPRYSEERKQMILSKLLPPLNMSVAQVARDEGIGLQTLYNWRDKAKQQGRPARVGWISPSVIHQFLCRIDEQDIREINGRNDFLPRRGLLVCGGLRCR